MVLLGLVAVAVFTLLGAMVSHGRTAAFDDGVRTWILAHRGAAMLWFFQWVSRVGSVTPMVLFAITGAVLLWFRASVRTASAVLVAPAAAVAAYLGLKGVFQRTRPSGVGNVLEGTYSFPSAHATTSAAICCTLAYVLWRERIMQGVPAVLLAVLVPGLVGMSRVYLDVHWATDVAGGWIAGIFIAALSTGLYDSTRRAASHHQEAGKKG